MTSSPPVQATPYVKCVWTRESGGMRPDRKIILTRMFIEIGRDVVNFTINWQPAIIHMPMLRQFLPVDRLHLHKKKTSREVQQVQQSADCCRLQTVATSATVCRLLQTAHHVQRHMMCVMSATVCINLNIDGASITSRSHTHIDGSFISCRSHFFTLSNLPPLNLVSIFRCSMVGDWNTIKRGLGGTDTTIYIWPHPYLYIPPSPRFIRYNKGLSFELSFFPSSLIIPLVTFNVSLCTFCFYRLIGKPTDSFTVSGVEHV
jgi:hypothetical protein